MQFPGHVSRSSHSSNTHRTNSHQHSVDMNSSKIQHQHHKQRMLNDQKTQAYVQRQAKINEHRHNHPLQEN